MSKSLLPHRIATCNGYKSLDTSAAKSVIKTTTDDADYVDWQEIETKGHRDAIEALVGWETYWPVVDKHGKPTAHPANATPLSWRTSAFPKVRRAGKSKKVLDGHADAYPDKYVNDIVLFDGAGVTWPFVNGHPPAQAFTSHRERYNAWRKVARALRTRTTALRLRYGRCVGGGDMNRSKWKPFVAKGVWGSHGTFGSAFYDVIWFAGRVERTGPVKRIATRSDHDALVTTLTATRLRKPKPERQPTAVERIIAIAKTQVGYHEGRSGSTWNNHQKYSPTVPGLEWSQNQAWCATFMSWLALEAGLKNIFPSTASTDVGARWFKDRVLWSESPSVGAQVFFGHSGDMSHTGLVIAFDADTITTIEGNTNTNGSPQGDGVYQLHHRRRDAWVQGYGHPSYPKS